MSEKYRVHELGKFNYSDIGEYIDENHTDRPLRNDILVELLNRQDKQIEELEEENRLLKQAFHLFSLLAEDYHLTFEQLFEITREAIEKKEMIWND